MSPAAIFIKSLFFWSHFVNVNEGTAGYYKKIWDESYEKSFKWQRPTQNMDFEIPNGPCKEILNYDFVIIGAGSAGAVMANRLSEIGDWKILLLEAGGEETEFSLMPGAYFPIHNTEKNWGYLTTPQKNACFNMKNNQCDFPRGKSLGGTTSLNGMYYIRGNKADYDDWNLPGWDFEDLVKYFKKAESVKGISGANRGTNGPLTVTYPNNSSPLTQIVFSAYKELGYSEVEYNEKNQLGYGRTEVTIQDGKRCSTNQAYLKPVRNNRKNLKILTRALATKILFNENKEATEVQFIHNNQCKIARFEKELILSAGVINTPQLLLLSGVGPRKDLENLDIKVVADLPVGLNVEDHVAIINIPTISSFRSNKLSRNEIFEEYSKKRGPLTDVNNPQLVFTATNQTLRANNRPEFEILFFNPPSFIDPQLYVSSNNLKDSFKLKILFVHSNLISVQVVLLHPKSKGKISLKSTNPLDFPLIDLNLLSHPDDVENLYQGFKDVLKIANTAAFSKIDLSFLLLDSTECAFLNGKEKTICYIKQNSASVYHTIASCRMGISPNDSVVDLDLKIHGFKKIRIVDSSVIPSSTGTHINAITIAFAEKIADTIKLQYFVI